MSLSYQKIMISNCHIYSELKLVERIIQMQEATISIHVGTRFSKAHNKRLVKGLEHIEYSPTEAGCGFFVLEEHDKNQLYVELFADSLEEFNERQKRNDRKIDYLTNGQPDGEKILKYMRSLKGREREVIFQVGKYSDGIDKNLKVEILKEMYEQFKTDNPNLKIIASYLHNDEADPHLHVDFIPVFTNTGKGVGKMVGFDKALCEQMSIQYERSAKGKNAKGEEINLNRRYHAPWFEQWRLMNHTHFSRLLHNYDIVPIKGGISNHRHKNTAEYQKKQDSMKTLQNSQDETIEEKGRKMVRHSYVQMRKLQNVSGHTNYIISQSRQELLLGTTQYVDAKYLDMFPNGDYWKDLAKYNQLAHAKTGNDGECVEAREIVFAYPEEFYGAFDPNELNEHMCQLFMSKYKVSVLSAIHLSEKNEEEGTFRNLHTHLVFSERKFTGDIKPAKRNIWRDEARRLITQQQAEELEKSYFIPKGSIDPFQKGGWTSKDNHLKSRDFTNEVKVLFTEEINRLAEKVGLDIPPLEVFDPNGI